MIYDFVIIGSGASGSVLSYYLTKVGAKVLLLEAGRAYSAATFPRSEVAANANLFWHGGMDPNSNASLVFLRGKVLGGGTVVNQALLDRFDERIFSEWRSVTGLTHFSESQFARHYDEIESQLNLHTIDRDEWNRNAQLYVEMFEKQGYGWAKLRRGQSQCASEDCIACLGGCRRDSKQSMLVTFLPKAFAQGLQIRTEFSAQQIICGRDQVAIYGQDRGGNSVVYGRKCVVAAGALGSTELLLRSGLRAKLPALGHGIHCHPQWMNIAFFDEPVDAHKGPLQAVKSDDVRFRDQGFKLENVFAGPIAISMLNNAHGEQLQHFMSRYRYMASLEVCVKDSTSGYAKLNRQNRLVVHKPLSDSEKQRGLVGVDIVNQLYRSVGAKAIFNSNFNFSLHVQGGCAIGVDPSKSVVDANNRVHGFENIVVADIATFPVAPGMNPSLTVMAQSHRASELLLAECGEAISQKSGSQKSGSQENGSQDCHVDGVKHV